MSRRLVERVRAERDDALRLRGVCPTCSHEAHDGPCAASQPVGEHWATCGCVAS